MLFSSIAESGKFLSPDDIKTNVTEILENLGLRRRVLLLPPDYTRLHSHAGQITAEVWKHYGSAVTDVMPATGTHRPMTSTEISRMFPGVPAGLFRDHDWRGRLNEVGSLPADFLTETAGFEIAEDLPVMINPLAADGGHDLILSIGQVVPHEVIGMANHSKNIFVGLGGEQIINRSHYIGAVYGMERIMGLTDTPVRRVLNYAAENYTDHLPIVYIQTVVSADGNGIPRLRGMFAGDGLECFEKAAELSRSLNINHLERKPRRVVVELPAGTESLWLGNKAVYRSRTAIEDDGELIVIAPGICRFGEDPGIDRLIRKYGYRGTAATVEAVAGNEDLRTNLCAAAHLIHGSSEGRFSIRYAAGGLDKAEIENAGYGWISAEEAEARFCPGDKQPGFNTDADGGEFYLIKNPAMGLWRAGAGGR